MTRAAAVPVERLDAAPAPGEPGARRAGHDVLCRALDREGIAYCVWPDIGARGGAPLAGATMALLVGRQSARSLERTLAELGYRRVRPGAEPGVPATECYWAMDCESGRLARLLVHYQIWIRGPRRLYRLPWEAVALASAVRDPVDGCPRLAPAVGVLLSTVSDLLAAPRPVPGRAPGASTPAPGPRSRSEAGRIDGGVGEEAGGATWTVARALLGSEIARDLVRVIEGGPHSRRTRASLRRRLASRLEVADPRGGETGGLWPRGRGRAPSPGRTSARRAVGTGAGGSLASGGILVAVVGVDGSGKSTVTAELERWLAPMVAVERIYFGSGKGAASWPRRTMRLAAATLRRCGLVRGGRGEGHGPPVHGTSRRRGDDSSLLFTVGDLLWVVSLAVERRVRAAVARSARASGGVVLCDRFPQSQIAGFNEGTFLADWQHRRAPLLRAAARLERAAIEYAEAQPPDLVIRLDVTPEVAQRRRPTMPMALLRDGIANVRALQYPPSSTLVEIDADQELERVLLQARRAVWSVL